MKNQWCDISMYLFPPSSFVQKVISEHWDQLKMGVEPSRWSGMSQSLKIVSGIDSAALRTTIKTSHITCFVQN